MMEFKINNNEWVIKSISKGQLLTIFKDVFPDEDTSFAYGVTIYPQQTIFINSDMCEAQQIKTLKHELTHCYIWNYGLYNVPHYTEEMVCDLVSSINDFINEVVNEYKSKHK